MSSIDHQPLSDKQQTYVDAIASLVTQPDRSSITQGVELAASLADQSVFAALLSGLRVGSQTGSRFPNHRRFPTPQRAVIFDQHVGHRAWLELAMLHLLAVSDLPLRSQLQSIALGTPIKKHATPPPTLWIDGLQRLTGLTHLDLHLTTLDDGIDLGALVHFPNLTHLRIRGRATPAPIGSLEKLQSLDGVKLQLEANGFFPALTSLRGRIQLDSPITPDLLPSLAKLEVRGGVSLVGFESLERLACSTGDVSLRGCRRIDHLSVAVDTFDAPDLRHVGLLDRASPGVDVSQLDTLDQVRLNRRSKFVGGTFPSGTKLLDPKVVLWGPAITSLGNIGDLVGLEVLLMSRVTAPMSLEPLRTANDLRVLDIRHSPGITDLSPLVELPNLEVLVLSSTDAVEVPVELQGRVQKFWRENVPVAPSSSRTTETT